jgi:SPP1 family predicted phage head-tail adaptor
VTAPIRSGSLTRPVDVQTRSTTRDSFGGQVSNWTTVKRVYAEVEALTGNERIAAQSVASEVSHRFTVRYDSTLWADPKTAATYRLVYRGRFFNIDAMLNVDESDRTVELLASEGLNNG